MTSNMFSRKRRYRLGSIALALTFLMLLPSVDMRGTLVGGDSRGTRLESHTFIQVAADCRTSGFFLT